MHVSPLPAMRRAEFTLKRGLAYLSWQRKRKHRFSADILARLVADIAAYTPDHTVITGDQCNLSLEAEFAHSADWLARFGNPHDVSVIPGNHDAHHPRMLGAWQQHWGAYMCGDDGDGEFPYLRVRGPVAIIGLSSAVATPLLFAHGRVGRAQRERLRHMLTQTQAHGLCRVLLIHHPLQAGAMRWRKSLHDAKALRALLAQCGAELVLHGHGHSPMRGEIAGPNGRRIAVRGCASASANGRGMPGAHYHQIAITPTGEGGTNGWQIAITHRHYDAASECFIDGDIETLTLGAR